MKFNSARLHTNDLPQHLPSEIVKKEEDETRITFQTGKKKNLKFSGDCWNLNANNGFIYCCKAKEWTMILMVMMKNEEEVENVSIEKGKQRNKQYASTWILKSF